MPGLASHDCASVCTDEDCLELVATLVAGQRGAVGLVVEANGVVVAATDSFRELLSEHPGLQVRLRHPRGGSRPDRCTFEVELDRGSWSVEDRAGPNGTRVVRLTAQPVTPELTPREREVLRELCAGKATSAISHTLGISARTVDKHLEHVYDKLQVNDRLSAVVAARELANL